jgi:hypothetical protein
MQLRSSRPSRSRTTACGLAAALALAGLSAPARAAAPAGLAGLASLEGLTTPLLPGNLLISRSVYTPATLVPNTTVLPPGCFSACARATTDGTYPFVWNNDLADSSFGITSKIYLDQTTASGRVLNTRAVPSDQLVTSFPSKSELALNLSTDGNHITFMGYVAPPDAIDASNSNTPAVIDPTNPVPSTYYRAVAELDWTGQFHFTETNAYSGNNGRAAILDDAGGASNIFTAGNAGNGGNPQSNGIILGAGAQILPALTTPESAQSPGTPTPVASFNITQLGLKADKIGKDDNFRGLTISGNVLYYTKGSGGNGVNTVYFVDTTGKACPTGGVGLPQPNAPLPTGPLSYDLATLQTAGLPSNMCILKGFTTALAKNTTNSFPFGIWFADARTLYVADEGNGATTYSPATRQYTAAAGQTTAGLQKWVFNSGSGSWQLAYTINAGLNLGAPYTVAGYPTGSNPATGLPWAPATDGLRNITGRVNRGGTATIWGVTSTVSGDGDQGADPNRVVTVTDPLGATTLPATDRFATVRTAASGEVLRGLSFTPGSGPFNCLLRGVLPTSGAGC